jgi:outer membrane protein
MRLSYRFAVVLLATMFVVPAARAQGGNAPASTGAPKIAFINSQTILSQAPGRAEAEAQFEKEMSTYRQQVQRMGDSLNTMVSAYQKAQPTLAPAARETREKAIREKQGEYAKRTQQLESQAQQRQAELVQPIMEQINKVINDIRAEGNYAMIFDAGSTAGVLVAADKSLDLTEQVLARLKTAPPVAAKPGAEARPAQPGGAPLSAPAGVTRPKTPPTQ